MSLTIRLATPHDASAVAEIHVAAWCAAYAGIMPDDYLDRLTVEHKTADWERWLRNPGPGTTLVCEREGRIMGFGVYGPARDRDVPRETTGELVALNVHPRHWRLGCGTALCRHVLREAQTAAWQCVTLWVLKRNVAAREFYSRLGFAPDGTERRDTHLIGTPLHELRYRIAVRQAPAR